MKNRREEFVQETFQHLGLTSRLDTRNRIILGQALAILKSLGGRKIDEFEILISPTGDILLRPRTSIPTRELWIHKDPKAMKILEKGLEDAAKARITKVKDLKKFVAEL
ncbi:MAG: hypothetical protein KAJ14_05055 [Candidatus Omnitrophica bacterium]|nr:hypothetical protein [Candidatus Omnitrophota bacterium]